MKIKAAIRIAVLVSIACLVLLYALTCFLVPWQTTQRLFSADPKSAEAAELVELAALPSYVAFAILTAEDQSFMQHSGFSFSQIGTALQDWIFEGKKLRGASSLSQQTARIMYLDNERSLIRKTLEFFATVELERRFSKRQILTLYLSYAEWGKGIFGLKQASQFYFSKQPEFLTIDEAVFLAVILASPQRRTKEFMEVYLSEDTRRALDRCALFTILLEQKAALGQMPDGNSASALNFLSQNSMREIFSNREVFEKHILLNALKSTDDLYTKVSEKLRANLS